MLAPPIIPWYGPDYWANRLVTLPIIGPILSHIVLTKYGAAQMQAGSEGAAWPETAPQDYVRNAAIALILQPRAFRTNAVYAMNLKHHLEDMQKIFNQICKLFRDVIKEKKLDIGFSEKPEVSDPAVSSSPTPGDAPASRTHTVVKGDTFWDLARKYYNNPLKWKDIQSANLRNGKPIPPRRLPIGTVLTIPG